MVFLRCQKWVSRGSDSEGANGIPDDVPIRATGNDIEPLVLHDVEQLRPDLARLAERLRVEEVLRRPIVTIPAYTVVRSGARQVPVKVRTQRSSTGCTRAEA